MPKLRKLILCMYIWYSAVVYDEFLEEFLQSGRELQIWRKVVLGARNNNFRRGATWNNNRGGGKGGGGREIWVNLPLRASAWKRRWKWRRSFSCYVSRLKMKNIQKKKIVRVSLLLITLFTMLNTICLGYAQGEKCQWINQRQERCRSETKKVASETKLSSKWKMFLQDTTNKESYFLFWLKK